MYMYINLGLVFYGIIAPQSALYKPHLEIFGLKFFQTGDSGPTKEEIEIAKHICFKTPNKSTQINKEDVYYFTGKLENYYHILHDKEIFTLQVGLNCKTFITGTTGTSIFYEIQTKKLFTIGSKAVDTIMASKWGTGKNKSKEVLFPTRESAADFMDL